MRITPKKETTVGDMDRRCAALRDMLIQGSVTKLIFRLDESEPSQVVGFHAYNGDSVVRFRVLQLHRYNLELAWLVLAKYPECQGQWCWWPGNGAILPEV